MQNRCCKCLGYFFFCHTCQVESSQLTFLRRIARLATAHAVSPYKLNAFLSLSCLLRPADEKSVAVSLLFPQSHDVRIPPWQTMSQIQRFRMLFWLCLAMKLAIKCWRKMIVHYSAWVFSLEVKPHSTVEKDYEAALRIILMINGLNASDPIVVIIRMISNRLNFFIKEL